MLRAVRLGFYGLTSLLAVTCVIGFAATDLEEMERLAQQRYGSQVARRVSDWRALVASAGPMSDKDKIDLVNRFVNKRIKWVEDLQLWGQDDYWASVLETFSKAAGDCEDFVIVKYVSLVLSGMPVSKLRMTYVRLVQRPNAPPVAHMVLAYYADSSSEPLILDNLSNDIVAASLRSDLTPVYSFNSAQLWIIGAGTKPSADDPVNRISRWRSVLQRMREEFTL